MSDDPVRGKTIRWSYEDGPMAGKAFEHTFAPDGTVTWRAPGGQPGEGEPSARYEAVRISPEIYLVTYLSSTGWTLTTTVDTKTRKIVSVASNEKQLVLQRGTLA